MSESKSTLWLYVSSDGRRVVLQGPFGLIAPPTVELHEPLVGPVTFGFVSAQRAGGSGE